MQDDRREGREGGGGSQENQSQALIQALVKLSVLGCSDRRGKVKLTKSTDTGTLSQHGGFSRKDTVGAKQLIEKETSQRRL